MKSLAPDELAVADRMGTKGQNYYDPRVRFEKRYWYWGIQRDTIRWLERERGCSELRGLKRREERRREERGEIFCLIGSVSADFAEASLFYFTAQGTP